MRAGACAWRLLAPHATHRVCAGGRARLTHRLAAGKISASAIGAGAGAAAAPSAAAFGQAGGAGGGAGVGRIGGAGGGRHLHAPVSCIYQGFLDLCPFSNAPNTGPNTRCCEKGGDILTGGSVCLPAGLQCLCGWRANKPTVSGSFP